MKTSALVKMIAKTSQLDSLLPLIHSLLKSAAIKIPLKNESHHVTSCSNSSGGFPSHSE